MLISENRHPVKTLAWLLVLCLLPGLGLILYIYFGLDNRKKRLIKQHDLEELKQQTLNANGSKICKDISKDHIELVNLLWRTNHAYPLSGNGVKIYTMFNSMLSEMITDLKAAKHHIHFEFFKFEDDEIGRQVEEVLIAKAAEGLEVRVLYDHAANIQRYKLYSRLRAAGVKVSAFGRIYPLLTSDTTYRNHRKIVVIDGRIGYIGGMNIAERYARGTDKGIWRDSHIRVAGPAVSDMQTCFLVDWQYSAKEKLSSGSYYPKLEKQGDVLMQIASSGPRDQWRVIMQGIIQMISQSNKYVYIQSPYLIPTESVMVMLRNAALSGVDVRVMIPNNGDRGEFVQYASKSYVKDALDAGVRVFFYTKGYLHSKTIVSDDKVVTIGSANIDVRSFEQDFEANAFIYDMVLASRFKEIFLEDQQYCKEIKKEEWEKRSKFKKFLESFARLFSPIL